jgi:undecaprenyl-diphosphatase
MEMSAASGLAIVQDLKLNPLTASTLGTGILIRNALNIGARRILIGIGGSATNDGGLGVAIALGTLPIVMAGMVLKLWVPGYENSVFRSIPSIAIVSIVMALLLALSELVGSRRRQLDGVQPRDGLWVGFAQALALLPGVSRSGSTLTASLFDGWDRAAAARFSFLLGIPAITLAGLVEVKDALHESSNGGLLPTLVGVIAAAVVSWLAIAWLLRFLQRNSTWIFVAYRLLFGFVLLVWFRDLGAVQP